MNLNRITAFLLGLTLTVNGVFAQDVEWSELVKGTGRGTNIYPDNGKNFYTTVWSGGVLLGSLQLKRYEDFMPVAQEKVNYKVNGGTGQINSLIEINGEMVAFISDSKENIKYLFYQKYSKSCTPISEPVELSQYEKPKGWNRLSYFNVLQSKNKEFFCVEYSIPGAKEESDRFGYKVFNKDFEVISNGEYESPYDPKESSFANRFLSNTGDYFVGMQVYNTNEKGKVKDMSVLKKYVVFLIKEDDMTEMELNIGADRRITDLSFSSDNERLLTCTGLYGATNTYTTGGVFYFQLDFKSQEIINQGFSEFQKDFITQDWTERQKARADKREAKGKGTPQLYSYDFREVQTTKDGGVVVIMEQYYVVVHTTRDPKTGATTTTYTYYYNDIIAYRVQNDGEFEWIHKLNKRQISNDDGGYYSSIGGYFNGDNYTFFFNDNNKNYNEDGTFVKPEKGSVAVASFRKKTNCVAKVELDIASGDFTRKLYTSRAETSAYAVPKKFEADYINNQMFMYFQYGKKEKFGLLSF